MNKIKNFSVLLLLLAIFLPTSLYAQLGEKPKDAKKNSPVISYLHGYLGAGYSSLLHTIDASNVGKTKVPGGGAGMLGIGYTLKHRKNPFIFKTGLEFMFLNSSTLVDSLRYSGPFNYQDPNGVQQMEYRIKLDSLKEQQNRFSINIPILFGAQFDMVYFALGAKVGLGLVNSYSTRSRLESYAVDPTLIDDLGNMPTHSFMVSKAKHTGNLNLGIDITGSAEFGIILDEWMPRNWKRLKNKNKTRFSYRAGLFADYGIMNINTNPQVNNTILPNDGVELDPSKLHSDFAVSSVLNTKKSQGKALNSLVVGAKFEVMVQASHDPIKRKRKRPRPRPKPVKKDLPDPPYFFAVVLDYETEEFLDAELKLYRLTSPHDTVFAATTPRETGYTETRLKSDRFGVLVQRPGYIDYMDTVWQINNDTLYVDLQPIKENTIVVLENLLFETGKTTVKNAESTGSIDEMQKLLVENPGLKIEISGHTDDVGSSRFNKRLSEGRAKAVYQIMVDRGIDPNRMTWRGAGEDEPIYDNDTEEGRAGNRRVEFIITENNVETLLFQRATDIKNATDSIQIDPTMVPEAIELKETVMQ